MLRSIISTVVGMTFAVIVITALEGFGKMLFPPLPPVEAGAVPTAVRYASEQPIAAQLWGPLSYTLGATIGVFIAGYYGRPSRLPAGLVVLFLASAILWNVAELGLALWLSALSLAAVLFGGLTGFGLAESRKAKAAMSE